MHIEFTFTWTFDEYRGLQYAHVEAVKTRRVRHRNTLITSPTLERRLVLTGVGMLTLIAFAGAATWFGHSLLTFMVTPPLLLPFVWIYWLSGGGWNRLRDAWLNNPDSQEPRTFIISDERLTQMSPGIQYVIEWSSVTHSFESKRFFLLFHGTKICAAIPKRAFPSPEDIKAFQGRCASLAPPIVGAFPVIH